MRWFYFMLVLLLGIMLQTTLVQALWIPTPVGWVGPELLAGVAVFVGLSVRTGLDAALAGYALGMTIDLTLSGASMGLLALLYAAGTAGVFQVRTAFFRDKVMTQMVLALLFCAGVYEVWTLYDLLATPAPAEAYWRRAVQALGLSAYTAVLAPVVYALAKRIQRRLLAQPSA